MRRSNWPREAVELLGPDPLERARGLATLGAILLAFKGAETAVEVLEDALEALQSEENATPDEILGVGVELMEAMQSLGDDTKELLKWLREGGGAKRRRRNILGWRPLDDVGRWRPSCVVAFSSPGEIMAAHRCSFCTHFSSQNRQAMICDNCAEGRSGDGLV